jgi:hypothetical protein
MCRYAAWLLELWVWTPVTPWVFSLFFLCLGSCLCGGPITCSAVCVCVCVCVRLCLIVCYLETTTNGQPRPKLGCRYYCNLVRFHLHGLYNCRGMWNCVFCIASFVINLWKFTYHKHPCVLEFLCEAVFSLIKIWPNFSFIIPEFIVNICSEYVNSCPLWHAV